VLVGAISDLQDGTLELDRAETMARLAGEILHSLEMEREVRAMLNSPVNGSTAQTNAETYGAMLSKAAETEPGVRGLLDWFQWEEGEP
jgi:hypothetical protein